MTGQISTKESNFIPITIGVNFSGDPGRILFKRQQMNVAVLLFEDFETLDVFGPVELFGRLKGKYQVSFYSLSGRLVNNSHGVSILTKNLEEIKNGVDIFLIPGGYGTRIEVNNILKFTNLPCKYSVPQ